MQSGASGRERILWASCAAVLTALGGWPGPAGAGFPYPACERADNACDPTCAVGDPSCVGPDDFAEYLFLPAPAAGDPAETPDDYAFDPADPDAGSGWKYQGEIATGPAAGLVGGLDLVEGWQVTTGRPDVVTAVLDSGIRWRERDVARKVALRTWELPEPAEADPPVPCVGVGHDCDGDGAVTVDDFAGITCQGLAGPTVVTPDLGGDPTRLDGQDLIRACSDGYDGYGRVPDKNGFVDDIAGWDFQEDDNDPFDDVDYGHGTGQAEDMAGEADNGGGFPGTNPNLRFLPLKVADSFVAVGTDFARAVVYAADWPVDVVSEALGSITAGPVGQQAVDYAWLRGIPVVASAADEQAQHHNYPANYEHTIWVNSVRNGDGTVIPDHVPDEGSTTNRGFDILNGCTNHGPRAWAAIPSTSCSSEATGRAGGVAALVVSHGLNLIDRGLLEPYCVASGDCDRDPATPFSAEEVRQIFRFLAADVDHEPEGFALAFSPTFDFAASALLGNATFPFQTSHFAAGPGWDPYTGHGRPQVSRLAGLVGNAGAGPPVVRIPPEADLSGGLRWFEMVDPVATPAVDVVASARAVRVPGGFSWTVEVGCGWDASAPSDFTEIASGFSLAPIDRGVLASWSPAATASACGFDPGTPVTSPDDHTVTLRLRVTDAAGNVGEDRRAVAVHHDPTEKGRVHVGASGEGSPALADVDRDGVLDVVYGDTSGAVHVLDGASLAPLPGFPVHTDPIPVHADDRYSGFGSGAVDVPREAVGGSVAADDLDGDGRVEIVAATAEGGVYVWNDVGRRRAGFPVRTDPALSRPEDRDRFNDADPGIFSAPTLADLDAPGAHSDLEIVLGSFDGHLYAWRTDGTPAPGFPARLADTSRVSVDPVTGRATPLPGSSANSRLRKIVGSPAVGDLDGDGRVEILAGTTEEYGDNPIGWSAPSPIFNLLGLLGVDLGDLDLDVTGRVHALHADGTPVAGWPVATPQLVSQLLPSVATGVSASPLLLDADGDGDLEVMVNAHAGPALVVDGDGLPTLGLHDGLARPLAIDFDGGGFPNVPATAGSHDAPFFVALGSGAAGDLDGDGLPEVVAPTAGLRKLLDTLTPGRQFVGHHQVTAWNADPASAGVPVPAFPQAMEDMQFISSPAVADVTGDGVPEVVQGSGTYLVRAFEILDAPDEAAAAGVAVGSAVQPAGWPKLTMGWIISSPAPGDVDGDGLVEVVVATREGNLFVWDTPAPATEAAIPWQGFGGDRRNTQNHESGVSPLASARTPLDRLLWVLESVERSLAELAAKRPAIGRSLALRFLPFVIARIEAGLESGHAFGIRQLPLVWVGLHTPVREAGRLAPLRHRLEDGLARAATDQVDAIACAPGDRRCRVCRWRAQGALGLAGLFESWKQPHWAVRFHARALANALRCER